MAKLPVKKYHTCMFTLCQGGQTMAGALFIASSSRETKLKGQWSLFAARFLLLFLECRKTSLAINTGVMEPKFPFIRWPVRNIGIAQPIRTRFGIGCMDAPEKILLAKSARNTPYITSPIQ